MKQLKCKNPECGSINIFPVGEVETLYYHCVDCGFNSYFTKEDINTINHIITKEQELRFAGFTIYENGESRNISLDEIIKLTKEGYVMEIKLVKPAIVKDMSIAFETIPVFTEK